MTNPQSPFFLAETVISKDAAAAMSWEDIRAAREDRDAVAAFLAARGSELLREMTADGSVHFGLLIPVDERTPGIIEGLVELTERPFFTNMFAYGSLKGAITPDLAKRLTAALDKWDAKFGAPAPGN